MLGYLLDSPDSKFLSWAYSFTVISALFVKYISLQGRAVNPSTPEHSAVELSIPVNLSILGLAFNPKNRVLSTQGQATNLMRI